MATKIEKVNEMFKKLRVQAELDCKFDKARMESQFDNTLCTCKWINYKAEWNEIYRVHDMNRKEVYRKLYYFYKVESELKITTKDELDLFITSDKQYTELHMLTTTMKEVIKYIEDIVDVLKAKNFEIKRFIEYQQFINGR
jgi:hypothetical protein